MRISIYLSSLLVAYCFAGYDPQAELKRKRDYIHYKDEALVHKERFQKKQEANQTLHEQLGKIKYSIIVGNLERAQVEIMKMKESTPIARVTPLLDRYHAIVYFLKEEYDRSLAILNKPHFKQAKNEAKICSLKILNLLILDKTQELASEWEFCRRFTQKYSDTQNLWLKTMVELKLQKGSLDSTKNAFNDLSTLEFSREHARVWLKMGLYLNEPEILYPFINKLTSYFLVDEDIRELIGLLYFRDGKFNKSYQFIEDLKTPNIENIKGNLYLLQEKLELAYAQFRLALTLKPNSLNAFERAIPLAWKLKQWRDGSELSDQFSLYRKDKSVEQTALKSAFFLMQEDYQNSIALIKEQRYEDIKKTPLELSQIMSYASLRQKNEDDVLLFGSLSCQKYDLLNCWVMYQMGQWTHFPEIIEKDQTIHHDSVGFLNQMKTPIEQTLQEELLIDQKDIEDLDRKLGEL